MSLLDRGHAGCAGMFSKWQGRLLHINDGANALEKVGGTFLQKLRGSALIINALPPPQVSANTL